MRIRSRFVQIKKSKLIDLGKVDIANSVTLATRVQADIMRVTAADQNEKANGKLEMFVSAYNSRPVIHVKERQGKRSTMTVSSLR